MSIKDLFCDYKAENTWKSICIELEVTTKDCNDIVWKYKYPLQWYRETDKIYEILNIHTTPTNIRKKIYNDVKNIYKEKFPVGEDTFLSWWVHFHTFLKEPITKTSIREGNNILNFKLPLSSYINNFLNLPLFLKVKDFNFFWRPWKIPNIEDARPQSITDFLLWWRNSAGWFRDTFRSHRDNTNNEFIKSIEFRCNNVIDVRLYWYYIWMLILAEQWINLLPLSKTMVSQSYDFSWKDYVDLDELKNLDVWCVKYEHSNEDIRKIKTNINILTTHLKLNWFSNASRQLKSYCRSMKLI